MNSIKSFAVFHVKATDIYRVIVHYQSGTVREYVERFWADLPLSVQQAIDSNDFAIVNERHAGAVDGIWYKRLPA